MARNYAALPHDYLEEMELLNDAEFGRICRALLKYSKDGEVPALSGSERVFFPRVRMQEDRFQASYESQIEKKREAGKRSAENRKATALNDVKQRSTVLNSVQQCSTVLSCVEQEPTEPNKIKTKTETKTETEIYPSSTKKVGDTRTRFVPPTLEEVSAYVAERRSPVDPQGFIDFYSAKGWMVGKTPMKDWKAACRNAEAWERWQKPVSKGPVVRSGPEQPEDPKETIRRMERYVKKLREEA